jgi:CHAT domain-containing protein
MAEFARLHETHEPGGYLTLLGYCDWMRGVIHHLEADEIGQALGFYQQALRSFAQARQQQSVASVHFLLAEHFALLGDTDQVWENLRGALALSDHVLSLRHLHTILKEAADAAVAQDLPLAALVFLNRAVALDLALGSPGLAAEAYLSRALTHRELGDEVAATEDLAAAREAMEAMTDPSSRRRVEAQLLVAEGQILPPDSAKEALDGALAYYSGNSFDALAAQLHLARGRAHMALDEVAAAAADFTAGIEAYERLRPAILKQQLRISYFDQARELFDEMIRLQVGGHGNFERAFEIAERSRARELLAAVSRSQAASGVPAPLGLAEIRQSLPADVVLLVYALLDDRLILWAVSHAEVVPAEVPLAAAELTAQVAAFAHQLRRGSAEAALAEELYRVLIGPLTAELPAGCRLVVLPDKALHALPFAALVDPATGRYLVEDHAVAIAPSSTILLRSPQRPEESSDDRVLVLGDPSFDTSRFPHLPRLPAALEEARQIAAGYDQAWVFTGEEATPEKLFELGGQASVVHLALHAVANEEYPLLSQLILAADDGDPGVVFAHELYGLAFPRTRLVVLSACRSGSGRISRGEGVLSLARPFLAAGVPAVVASLWDLDDESGAALFGAFYEYLGAGATPIDALRRAQLELISDPDPARRRGPAAWAGFVIFAGALAPLS